MWGEKGYMRMARNIGNAAGQCGLAMQVGRGCSHVSWWWCGSAGGGLTSGRGVACCFRQPLCASSDSLPA